jgi:hypothetical protein
VVEDPVAGPEVEVQRHRVGEGSLRLDGRLPLREDGEAEGADLRGKPGGDSLGTGDQDLVLFHPKTHLHSGLLTQPPENAMRNRIYRGTVKEIGENTKHDSVGIPQDPIKIIGDMILRNQQQIQM